MLRKLVKLAIPMVVGQLAFASMGFIDTVLMGQLGVDELAGGALGSMVFQFFHVVGIGVLVATSNLIAFSKGQGKDEEVHRSLLSGVIMVAMLSLLFGLIIWFATPILTMLGQDPKLLLITQTYLDVIVWGLLPAFLFILLRSLALGLGEPSAVLPVSVVAALANYPISYILMTGQFGLPAMGIKGVALGTVIVACFMAFGMAFLLYRKAMFQSFKFWQGWSELSYQNIRETLRLGIPIAIAHAMEIGLFSAAALLAGAISAEALAAHQIVLQCVTVSFMFPLGLSQAVSVKVGKHFGGGRAAEVKAVILNGLLLASLTAMFAGAIFWLLPEQLVELFIDDAGKGQFENVLALATSLLLVGAMFQLVDGWQVVIMGILRGFKLGTSPTVIAVVSYWGIGFPAAYFLGNAFGAVGIWSGLGIGLASSALMLVVLLLRTYRKAF